MKGSLSGRLLAGVFILLLLFFGVTVAALDSVFLRLTDAAMHNRLEGQLVRARIMDGIVDDILIMSRWIGAEP